jgi:hypothetical protein
MRKWLVLMLLMLFLAPSQAQAQAAITFENLEVHLWSEYDQPSMLVIYDFQLTADTPLPASVKLRIPRDANIIAVAFDENGGYMNAEFAGPTEEGNWQVVTLFVKAPTAYRLEYYQPLQRDGNVRTFKYQWSGEYAVNTFRIDIQVPEDSTAVKSTPMVPFAPSQPFLNGSAARENLAAGETYTVDLEYARTSEDSVVQPASPQVTASEPITADTAGRVTLDNLPYILGGVGLLLIVGAAYYFWQSRSTGPVKTRTRSQRRDEREGPQTYCHECGTRANAEDRFCRVCGTKIRTG